MDFWLPVVVVIVGNSLFFVFCSIVKDNSWIDAWWGLSFILPLAALMIKRQSDYNSDPLVNTGISARVILSFVCVSLWGLRLGWHIAKRHTKEDFRYVEFRERWNTGGPVWLYVQFYLKIFFLQGVFSLIVNSAALYVAIYSSTSGLIWTDYLGAAVWLFGFIFELVGDAQLAHHIADKTPGKPKFIAWGLWRYTRHPNYFGEAVLWWGVWIIACSIQWGWITVYSCIFITLLVRYVSGVPMLEKKYEGRPDWTAYCEETNVFFPWFVNYKSKN